MRILPEGEIAESSLRNREATEWPRASPSTTLYLWELEKLEMSASTTASTVLGFAELPVQTTICCKSLEVNDLPHSATQRIRDSNKGIRNLAERLLLV